MRLLKFIGALLRPSFSKLVHVLVVAVILCMAVVFISVDQSPAVINVVDISIDWFNQNVIAWTNANQEYGFLFDVSKDPSVWLIAAVEGLFVLLVCIVPLLLFLSDSRSGLLELKKELKSTKKELECAKQELQLIDLPGGTLDQARFLKELQATTAEMQKQGHALSKDSSGTGGISLQGYLLQILGIEEESKLIPTLISNRDAAKEYSFLVGTLNRMMGGNHEDKGTRVLLSEKMRELHRLQHFRKTIREMLGIKDGQSTYAVVGKLVAAQTKQKTDEESMFYVMCDMLDADAESVIGALTDLITERKPTKASSTSLDTSLLSVLANMVGVEQNKLANKIAELLIAKAELDAQKKKLSEVGDQEDQTLITLNNLLGIDEDEGEDVYERIAELLHAESRLESVAGVLGVDEDDLEKEINRLLEEDTNETVELLKGLKSALGLPQDCETSELIASLKEHAAVMAEHKSLLVLLEVDVEETLSQFVQEQREQLAFHEDRQDAVNQQQEELNERFDRLQEDRAALEVQVVQNQETSDQLKDRKRDLDSREESLHSKAEGLNGHQRELIKTMSEFNDDLRGQLASRSASNGHATEPALAGTDEE